MEIKKEIENRIALYERKQARMREDLKSSHLSNYSRYKMVNELSAALGALDELKDLLKTVCETSPPAATKCKCYTIEKCPDGRYNCPWT